MLEQAEAKAILLREGLSLDIERRSTQEIFLRMCKEGRLEAVKAYLALGMDTEVQETISLETPLIRATEGKHISVIDALLEAGALIEGRDRPGDTALMTAANWGHLQVVEHLAKRGADLHPVDNNGLEPLSKSIQKDKPGVTALMLRLGADPTSGSERGQSALQYAIAKDDLAIVKKLLAHKGDPNVTDMWGKTALHRAVEQGSLEIVKALVEAGASVIVRDRWGWNAQEIAALQDRLAIATFLASKSIASRDVQVKKAFFDAAKKGDLHAVGMAIAARFDPNLRDPEGRTALMLAAENGRTTVVELLLEASDRHALDKDGANALWYAVKGHKKETALRLIQAGLDPNTPNVPPHVGWEIQDGLYYAFQHQDLDIFQALVEAGADITNLGRLSSEMVYGRENTKFRCDVLRYLGKKGADLDMIERQGISKEPLLYKLAYRCPFPIIEALLEAGASIDARAENGQSVLHYLAFFKNDDDGRKLLRLLLQRGAKYDFQDIYGDSPLDQARRYNRPEILTVFHEHLQHTLERAKKDFGLQANAPLTPAFFAFFLPRQSHHDAIEWLHLGRRDIVIGLLDAGLPPSLAPPYSHSLLDLAVEKGDLDLLERLSQKKADLKIPKKYGGTTLSFAVEKGQVAIVRKLLEAGADPKTVNDWGETPLHAAATQGHLEILDLLLQAGADLSSLRTGWTPLIRAAQKGFLPMAQALLQRGAFLEGRNERRRNALFYAIEGGHTDLAEFLIAKGIDIHLADEKGQTPLHLASTKGSPSVVSALLKAGADPIAADLDGQTPVSLAAPRKEIKAIFRSLCGIKIPLADDEIEPVDQAHPLSPWMRAIYNSNDALFREYWQPASSLQERNYRGDTPLMVAIGHKHDPAIEAILQAKPDLSAKNVCGDTAITYALVYGGKDLARKIQPSLQDHDLDHLLAELDLNSRLQRFKDAVKKGDISTVETMITSKEIDINFVSPDDRPLWLAMEAFDLTMVQRLLAYGADPSLFYLGIIHAFDLAKSSKNKAIKSFFSALKKEWKSDPRKAQLLTQGVLGETPDTDDEDTSTSKAKSKAKPKASKPAPPPKTPPAKPSKEVPKPATSAPKPVTPHPTATPQPSATSAPKPATPPTQPATPPLQPATSAPKPVTPHPTATPQPSATSTLQPAAKGARRTDIEAVRRGERTGKGKAAKQPAIREMFVKGGADGRLQTTLAGKIVVVSGEFENFHRLFLEVELQERGALLGSEVSKDTDILIAGSKPGIDLQRALRYKIPIWTEGELFKRLDAPPTQAKDALPSGARLQEGRILERGETPLPMPPGVAGSLALQWIKVELPIHPATAEMWGPSLAIKAACVGRLVYQGKPLTPKETEAEVFRYSRWADDGTLVAQGDEDLGGRQGFFCAGLLAALKAKTPLVWEKASLSPQTWRLEIRDRWDRGTFVGYEAEAYQIDLQAKTLGWSHRWVAYHFGRR